MKKLSLFALVLGVFMMAGCVITVDPTATTTTTTIDLSGSTGTITMVDGTTLTPSNTTYTKVPVSLNSSALAGATVVPTSSEGYFVRSFTSANQAALFRMSVTANTVYRVYTAESTTGSWDTVLGVYNGAGGRYGYDDDGGVSLFSDMQFRCSYSGYAFFAVSPYSSSTTFSEACRIYVSGGAYGTSEVEAAE